MKSNGDDKNTYMKKEKMEMGLILWTNDSNILLDLTSLSISTVYLHEHRESILEYFLLT